MTKPQAILSSDAVKLVQARVASFLQPHFYLKCISRPPSWDMLIRFVLLTSLSSDWLWRTHVIMKINHTWLFLAGSSFGKNWKVVFAHTGFLSRGPHSVSCGTHPLGKSRDVLTSSFICCAWREEQDVHKRTSSRSEMIPQISSEHIHKWLILLLKYLTSLWRHSGVL